MADILVNPERALVTGASGDIGLQIARKLVEQGKYVDGVSTTPERAGGFVKAIGGSDKGFGHVLDLTDLREVNTWCRDTFSKDVPGIVIHAAGVTNDAFLFDTAPVDDREIQELLDVYAINALAPHIITRRLLGAQRRAGAELLYLSSIGYHNGNAKQAKYLETKASLEGLMMGVAEIASLGAAEGLMLAANRDGGKRVTANAIAYGPVQGRMWGEVAEGHRNAVEADMSLGRAYTPEEAADAAMQALNSRESGKVFVFDGGLLARAGITNSRFVQLG